MKYAIIYNNIVSNIITSESKEDVENFYKGSLIFEVTEKENLTSEEHHLYLPHIGLRYSEETGYEQPEIIQTNEEPEVFEQTEIVKTKEQLKEDYLNGKAAAEAHGQTVWIDGKWAVFTDEQFSEYQANVRDNKIALKTDKARFDIPE